MGALKNVPVAKRCLAWCHSLFSPQGQNSTARSIQSIPSWSCAVCRTGFLGGEVRGQLSFRVWWDTSRGVECPAEPWNHRGGGSLCRSCRWGQLTHRSKPADCFFLPKDGWDEEDPHALARQGSTLSVRAGILLKGGSMQFSESDLSCLMALSATTAISAAAWRRFLISSGSMLSWIMAWAKCQAFSSLGLSWVGFVFVTKGGEVRKETIYCSQHASFGRARRKSGRVI